MAGVTPTGLAALLLLELRNTSLVLLMRTAVTSGSGFLPSTAVCCDEAFKLCTCTVVMAGYYFLRVPDDCEVELPRLGSHEAPQKAPGKSFRGLFRFFMCEVFGHGFTEILKLALPAMCYTLQKNCLYLAITHLEAAVYMVTYQAKILTTALFSCTLLGKPMSYMQVLALCMLMAGVSIVQICSVEEQKRVISQTGGLRSWGGPEHSPLHSRGQGKQLDVHGARQNPLLGLLAVTVACLTSGFSGVWFELVLKTPSFEHSRVDRELAKEFAMWVRNIHLAIFALTGALIGAFAKDGEQISKAGFLQGYTHITWLTVLLEAAGGILVAIVIKYTDNILKNFATAISILTATIFSACLLGFRITPMFLVGMTLVLVAVTVYQRNPPDGNNNCTLCTSRKAIE
eukprot:TRINITY_DN52840_c0_g1_i1.p1 TRINITY_DN52840_c0_g1~~TRINITY_DN52840_c0_g1_i1.p1  ORF type:complete len:409 (+),score=59.01 TRINITY_DN52840_c0_g1_i1:30-1229(+)